MPAQAAMTAGQLTSLHSGSYQGDVRVFVMPNTVVFEAEVNETINGAVFAQFAYNNVTTGAYTDVRVGQTVIISTAGDLRQPLLRGRVRKAPTATTFYLNETSFALTAGQVVTVINTFELWQKDRSGNLVDWDIPYAGLPPIIRGLQSFYYAESGTSASFSLAPVGQAMADGATISSYAWNIPGATYTVGSSSTQNITVTIPAGHRWCTLTVTDSSGQATTLNFDVLVCGRDDPAYLKLAHGDVTITGSLDNGWNASLIYYAGMESVLDRTRCAIIGFDRFGSGTPNFNPVLFVGYARTETSETAGDVTAAQLQQTRLELQGFAALSGELPVPSLAIRHRATPAAWEEMKYPTVQRVVAHLSTRYSNLASLCALDLRPTDNTWYADDLDVQDSTLFDTVRELAGRIQAALVFYPQGDAALELNACFLSSSARNALPVIASGITVDDLYRFDLPVTYARRVGQVTAGAGTYNLTSGNVTIIRAIAPASAPFEGSEAPVIPDQLMPAGLSDTAALSAARERVGNLLEWLNPPTLLNATFTDGWRCLTPSQAAWYTFDLPATENARGIAVTTGTRWLLLSVSLTWNLNGQWDVAAQFRRETVGGTAQISAAILPNMVDTGLPVLPPLADYDAFPPPASLDYPSTTVPATGRQPFGRGMFGSFAGTSYEDAQAAADNAPELNCEILSPALNFKSSATRQTDFISVGGEQYVVTVRGSAKIASGSWQQIYDFTTAPHGFAESSNLSGQSTWVAGLGYESDGCFSGILSVDRIKTLSPAVSGATITGVTLLYTATGITGLAQAALAIYNAGPTVFYQLIPGVTNGVNKTMTFTGTFPAAFDQIEFQLSTDICSVVFTAHRLTLTGTGTNPFTGSGGTDLFADAFYRWTDGGAAELHPTGSGLLVDGVNLAVPPEYNPSHEYTFLKSGTGGRFSFKFADSDYSDNQNLPLYVRVCLV